MNQNMIVEFCIDAIKLHNMVYQRFYSDQKFNQRNKYAKSQVLLIASERGGHMVRVSGAKFMTLRMQCLRNQLNCVYCGLRGEEYRYERASNDLGENRYHFNLYGFKNDSDGNRKSVLMTVDHIVPRSLGGKDSLENLATACFECNYEKKSSNALLYLISKKDSQVERVLEQDEIIDRGLETYRVDPMSGALYNPNFLSRKLANDLADLNPYQEQIFSTMGLLVSNGGLASSSSSSSLC